MTNASLAESYLIKARTRLKILTVLEEAAYSDTIRDERAVTASAWLRKEREFSFYGDIDFIPTERYSREDAVRAIDDAQFVVTLAERIIRRPRDVGPDGEGATRHRDRH